MKIIIFLIKTVFAVVLATVFASSLVLLILGREDSLFSLNADNSYPDLIISRALNTSEAGNSVEPIEFDQIKSFIATFPEAFGNIIYTDILKTRANVNSGNTKSNLDVYSIDQDSFVHVISSLTNSVSGEYSTIDSAQNEVIVGSHLAMVMDIEAGDELIISMTGDKFWYYSELFHVKYVANFGNSDFDNAIIMSRNYIDSISTDDDNVSLFYLSTDQKDSVVDIQNALIQRYNDRIDVLSRNDYINGYDLYLDMFNVIPLIYALLFSSMLLFIHSINLKSRYIALSMLKQNLSSKVFIVAFIAELIVAMLFFVIALPITEALLRSLYTSVYSAYRMQVAVISIFAITIITAISYLLCIVSRKKD